MNTLNKVQPRKLFTEAPKDWELVDEFDNEEFFQPACFLSREGKKEFEYAGEKIMAFTWLHAGYLWIKDKSKQHSKDGQQDLHHCQHCGHRIRYVSLFQAPDQTYYLIGRDCARFIESAKPRSVWLKSEQIKDRLEHIRLVQTKNGARYVLSAQVPGKVFWDTFTDGRPKWLSVQKREDRRVEGSYTWWWTIWGEHKAEVLNHYFALRNALKGKAEIPKDQIKPKFETAATIDNTRLLELFHTAKQTLDRPKIRIEIPSGQLVLACLDDDSLLVRRYKPEYAKLGYITPQGVLQLEYAGRAVQQEVVDALNTFSSSPIDAATKYGKMTGNCCFCGRGLSDARSVKVGFGPKCATSFGLQWGDTK